MIIRKLQLEDLDTRVEWMNNPKVYSSMHFDIPVLLDNTIKWFKNNLDKDNRIDVVFEEGGMLVAMGGLTNINKVINKAELYIFVNPNLQRGGIGTKATSLLCKYGFDELKLNKIFLETNEDNDAAKRVYEKCGFQLEGILREEYKTSGNIFKSRYYYGMLKGELNE
ncbi:MAG: GNAT family N-acetyltransferase [Bacteroides sp.]|nr:GNAT family N-acetyltransferase [Bacteroides sp.]